MNSSIDVQHTANLEEKAPLHGIRIAYLTQWSTPYAMAAPPGRIADALRDAGGRVAVISGPPYDWTTNTSGDGQRWWRRSSQPVGSYPARRYPFYPGQSRSSVARLAMYGTFAASTSMLSMPALRSSDVNVVYGSPATAATAALIAKRRYGTPFVYIVQDVWPDSIFATGYMRSGALNRAARESVDWFVRNLYREAGHVIAISESMRDLLVARGADPAHTSVMYNWADEDAVGTPIKPPCRSADQPLRLLYAGNLGFAQRLDLVLDAMAQLEPGTAELDILGKGAAEQELRHQVDRLGLTNVRFLGHVEPSVVRVHQQGAHLHLVSLGNDPLFEVTVPSKLQSLMASGAPILAFAPGEVERLVSSMGIGLTARPGDPYSLAQEIRQARQLPPEWYSRAGLRARAQYLKTMSREIGHRALSDSVLESLAVNRPRISAWG